MSERLLVAEEVAEMIGMRVEYVYALTRRDAIPHLQFGRSLRFRRDSIEAWLLESERGTLVRPENGPAAQKRPGPGTRR